MSDEPASSRTLHPFWDRSIRFLLQRPAHLRAILSLCHPELAGRLDFERLETIDRSFILDDYRQREADLVVRLPYQAPAGPQEVIVYLLLEHQSSVDAWMPLRLLFYMLQIWEDERTRSQAGGGPVRLPPIIPAVFYTGSRPWTASRELVALIDGPAELSPFVPRFDILYAGLSELMPGVLEQIGPLGWALRAVQRVEADQPEFAAVLERAARAIRPLLGDEWRELASFLVLLITHRRPHEEFADLQDVLQAAAANQDARTELIAMGKSSTQVWFEEGLEQGLEKGRLETLQQMILRLGQRRYGAPTAAQRTRLESITDARMLEALSEAVLETHSWDELLSRV